ncbi:hypothetical protein SAMN05661012_05159 [Chitinophaga sancti]|uniref:Uncharacterized protein n=1 Tax=Chitinophaga sancti TaxID=1004 RepID=A0A1K1SCE0_9BACT|nr:hypothetical protein SAMN05661012_05159 [Chitinophaga sancti]
MGNGSDLLPFQKGMILLTFIPPPLYTSTNSPFWNFIGKETLFFKYEAMKVDSGE